MPHNTVQECRYASTVVLFALLLFCLSPVSAQPTAQASHAIAMYGDTKYPADFSHFDYANPSAPKGGTLQLAVTSSSGFDSLNPFVIKGISAAGMAPLGDSLLYQSLATKSADEPFTLYGLVAKRIEIPDDRSWIIFHIDPAATFHDGHAIDAADVVFSFNTLIKYGMPLYSAYYADVARVEALDDRRVKFSFSGGENRELPLIVSELPILPEHFWQGRDFAKTTRDTPLGSGPYKIASVDMGRSVSYTRVKDWWAVDHPTAKGRYNFDNVNFDYYRDTNVSIEALKAGEYDYRAENSSKAWATSYTGPNFDNGAIVKRKLADGNPNGMQAYIYNTRRTVFSDSRVREALAYAFDFEWTNRQLFFGQYQRTHSYFSGSELAARGLPSREELALLEPFRDQLPERVFTTEYRAPSTEAVGGFRKNLRIALRLLSEAGWTTREGKLVDSNNSQMQFEILYFDPSSERIHQPFATNLRRMGIDVELRLVDTQQYIARLNTFDYDMTALPIGQSISPGNEQRDFWSSARTDREGGRNYAGIKDPAVDALVESLISAPDRAGLVTATRALDRVLLWGHYVIPQWHYSWHRLVYWDRFDRPKLAPTYAIGLFTWWAKDA